MEQNELEIFKKFVSLSIVEGFIYFNKTNVAQELKKYDLDFEDFIHLADIGLFNTSLTLSWEINFDIKKSYPIMFGKNKAILTSLPESSDKISFNILKFTDVSKQLFPLLVDNSENAKLHNYINDLTKFLESRKYQLNIV
jgi:hypothetical protein